LFRRRAPQASSFAGPDAHFGLGKDKNRKVVVYYNDGPTATVTVRGDTRKAGKLDRSIYLNGKSDGNLINDYPTTSLLALIPALMAEKVERCFVIGFGTGVSIGELAALEWVQRVDVAEISQAVIEAAPLFDEGNLGASKNPKVTIRRGDAYRTLMRTEGKYDVIVSEPSNPWVSGVEMLYSIEFLEAARSHLAPGGVYAQWMHLYALDAETVELILRNYAAVFPHVSVWSTQPRDLVLLGFDAPERALDLATLTGRYGRPDFAAGLKRAGIESIPGLLSRERLPLGTLHASDLDGPFHTLRHPRLSDMAVRAFMIGKHATLPKLPAPKSAEIGSQNSLLRRYVGGEKGPLPEGVSELAVREMVKLQLMPEAATLLADWRRGDPKSEALNALLTELRSQPPIRSLIADGKLAGLGRLFGGQPVRNLESRRSLRRAKQISEAYRIHYHHAVPFDRSALRGIWGNCSAKGCREAQHQAEKQLGKIEAPRRGEIQRRIPGAGSPVPNEVTDTADRSESPESS
jgi:SAM-dependent methyltransferase